MFNMNYIFIVGAVIVIAVGQITFKYAALQLRIVHSQTLPCDVAGEYLAAFACVAAALLLYLISTIAWVQALRTVPLSIAFTFNSLAFVLVPAAGFRAFRGACAAFFSARPCS